MKNMKKWIGVILMLSLLTSLCACGQLDDVTPGNVEKDNSPTFKIAMAIADITPNRDVYLDGYEAHDASSLAKYPDNFTTDLKARILVVDNGTDRLVFVNLEMIFSGSGVGYNNLSEYALDAIAEACQTTRENVLLSNTHNHQANQFLGDVEEENILNAVKEAYARLAPAKIGTTTVNTEFGMSRGGNYTVDENEPYDSLMSIIRFDNAETGEPIGLIYSVPMHGTMFGNGPGLKAKHNLLNCEFTGYTSRAIEASMAEKNPNFAAMHINGFYGNATPFANGKYYAESEKEMAQNGAAFAKEILKGYNTIETKRVTGEIVTNLVKEGIPTNKTNQEFRKQFGDYDNMPLYVTLGAFGDIGFVGVNYEPFSIIGARLKAESPYRTLMPAGNVNGWNGYIPTKEVFAKYEKGVVQAECGPSKSPFDADGEEAFYTKVLDSVCDMAGVTLERVPMEKTGVQDMGKTAVYTYELSGGATLDKLVISFGQDLRTDCAQDFDLMAFNSAGEMVFSKTYEGSTVNYLGEFLDGAEVAKVTLAVRTRYGSGKEGVAELDPQLYGIQFTAK